MLRANGLRPLFLLPFLPRTLETYSESLEVIDAQGIAEQVEERILEHAAVAVAGLGRNACQSHDFARGFSLSSLQEVGQWHLRKDESVAVQPLGVLGVELHELVPENVSNRSHTPAESGVSSKSWAEMAGAAAARIAGRRGQTYMGAPGCPELLLKVASTCDGNSRQSIALIACCCRCLRIARSSQSLLSLVACSFIVA